MKKHIPASLKLNYKLSARFFNDLTKGNLSKFAKGNRIKVPYQGMIETKQPILSSNLQENKVKNIRIATQRIAQLQILPDEIFSFWKAIGKPTSKKGYKVGRNIIKGELSESVGGGLCQLSGIIYHTALKAGLEIIERHPHSIDIYKESERYTPLGSDATVVYGYKDLRIKNPYPFPIKFTFLISDDSVSCRVFMEDNLPARKIKFERNKTDEGERVLAVSLDEDGNKETVAESFYIKQEA